MRLVRSMIVLAAVSAMVFAEATIASADNPAVEEREATLGQRRGGPPQGRGGRGRGRGRGRRGVATMTVSLTAWTDGGRIPLKYTQVGGETSPGVAWSNVPTGTASFVLIFHDLDGMGRSGTDTIMHWLLWNIPATTTSIPQGLPEGFELEGGTRQISDSGPRYRGPGAMAGGSVHHYVMELYALDTLIDVEVVARVPRGSSPADNARAEVFQAMEGHILGKGAYVGLFRRP